MELISLKFILSDVLHNPVTYAKICCVKVCILTDMWLHIK